MDRLEGFVASALLQRVRTAAAEESIACGTSFRGAALFVDISDYTLLAERLCNQGANGVEQLGEDPRRGIRRLCTRGI